MATNNLVEKDSYDSIDKSLEKLMDNGTFFLNMPFKPGDIVQFTENGKKGYLCDFEYQKAKDYSQILSGHMYMQVLGIISEKMKKELNRDSLYFLTGRKLKLKSGLAILQTGGSISDIFLPTTRVEIVKVESVQ